MVFQLLDNVQFMDFDAYEYLFKIVLIGDSGVGKSNLLLRYSKNQFSEDQNVTIGVEFASKTLKIENSFVKTQIWDTAGQERYRAITQAYYRNALGALMVYDITSYDSYRSIKKWMREVKDNSENGVLLILIGNKSDLKDQREVRYEEAQKFAEKECKC